MKKNKVIIRFEVGYGAIYLSYYEDGDLMTDSKLVNQNQEIIQLNRKLGEIYNSWFSFDEYEIPRQFNEEKQIEDSKVVLDLLLRLKEEITKADSNVIIEDFETDFYKSIVRWMKYLEL